MKGKEKKQWIDRIPSTVTFLLSTLVLATIFSYIIPAGEYERITDAATNVTTVDPNSFHFVENQPVSIWKMFQSVYTGFVGGGNITFLVLFGYFWVYTLVKSGTFHSGIGILMSKGGLFKKYYIIIFSVLFALAGSVYGELTATYGLLPIFIGLATLMGHDALVGMSICGMACAVGSAAATTNPYTLAIAQNVAELPLFSGLGYRWICFAIFIPVCIWYTMRYAKKIEKDPTKSIVADLDFSRYAIKEEDIQGKQMTTRQKLILTVFLLSVVAIVVGSIKFKFGLSEVATVFIIGGLIMSLVAGYGTNEIAKNFCDSSYDVFMAVILIGLARSIFNILQDSKIIDTIIFSMYQPIKSLSPGSASIGMLFMQTIINFFIPSGSGQAVTIMPIMVPLADLLHVSRQTAVLAFHFGDGFSNLLWPTAHVGIMLGVTKIPFGRWAKFFLPLFGIFLVLQCVLVYVATLIDYGPF